MTPMIDVVFLLIVFFLVSSHLARREARLELPLPSAATGERDTTTSPRLTINVLADGSTLLGATPAPEGGLAERLRTAAAEHGGELRVRVRGDRTVGYGAIEPVLAACAEAGIVDIGFGVFRDTPEE